MWMLNWAVGLLRRLSSVCLSVSVHRVQKPDTNPGPGRSGIRLLPGPRCVFSLWYIPFLKWNHLEKHGPLQRADEVWLPLVCYLRNNPLLLSIFISHLLFHQHVSSFHTVHWADGSEASVKHIHLLRFLYMKISTAFCVFNSTYFTKKHKNLESSLLFFCVSFCVGLLCLWVTEHHLNANVPSLLFLCRRFQDILTRRRTILSPSSLFPW